MPRSLLVSAILFIGFGILFLLLRVALGFTMSAPLWVPLLALLGGFLLLRGQNSGRVMTTLVVALGLLSVIFDMIHLWLAPSQSISETWLVYGRGFLAIAILTLVLKALWSRSVSDYLNRV